MPRGFSANSGGASVEVAPGWLEREVPLTLVLVIKDWNKANVTLRLKNTQFYSHAIILTDSIPYVNQTK